MLFGSFDFFIFFTLVLIINWILKKWSILWRIFLLLVSYYFYSFFDLKFLSLLIIISFVNYFLIKALTIDPKWKKFYLSSSIIFNLIILGIFKYYDFFRVSFSYLFSRIGLPFTFPLLEIILPIGLSFYIFRAISYDVDVYLGKTNSASILNLFLYLAFFPHLLSGPITRSDEFLLQLQRRGMNKIENPEENLTLILSGLFKKLFIATYLSLYITDDIFAVPENHSFLLILLAVFAYSLVIYFDFSGYSEMAVGFAGLLGLKIPRNFNAPYLSLNVREFWKKWHITLSSWVKDYIYIPLGGNRKGKIRKYLNLMIAMILIGFWHGANFHFIIWGILMGIGLVVYHFWHDFMHLKPKLTKTSKFISWFVTFNFISFSWIFFRAENMERAKSFLKTLFSFQKIFEPFKLYAFFLFLFGFLFIIFEKKIFRFFVSIQKKMPIFIWIPFILLIFLLIYKLKPDIIPGFIYFNF